MPINNQVNGDDITVSTQIAFVIASDWQAPGARDDLNIRQSVVAIYTPAPNSVEVVSNITAAHDVDQSTEKPSASTVKVGQVIGLNFARTRRVSHQLSLTSSVLSVLIPGGVSGPTATGLTVRPPIAGYYAGLTPGLVRFIDGATTLTLRKPQFGDSGKYSASRIYKTTRDLTRIVYRDPDWPTVEVQDMTFENVGDNLRQQVSSFFHAALGKQIDFYDHLGRHWLGVVLSPVDIIQHARGRISFKVTFQGVLA